MSTAKYLPNEDIEDVPLNEYRVSTEPLTTAEIHTDSLISALNDVSGSAIVSVHRQNGNGKESLSFLDSFPADKYAADDLLLYLKNTYGSGDYRIHVRENGKLRANRFISIEAPTEKNNASGGDPNLLTAIQSMNDQIRRQNETIAGLMQGNNNQSEEKFLEKMLMYKQLFGGESQSKPQGFQEILSTVAGLKKLGINVGGIETEKEDGFGDILDKAMPAITALLERQPQPHPQTHPQYKPNPSPKGNDMKFNEMKIKMGIATLVKAASKNSDIPFYADFVVDQVSRETLINIFKDNPMENLIRINPKAGEFREWFEELGEHVKGILGLESKYFEEYNGKGLTGEDKKDITGEIIQETPKNAD